MCAHFVFVWGLNNPNQVRKHTIGDMTVSKQTYQPGFQWSKDIKPIAKTNSCQIHHWCSFS